MNALSLFSGCGGDTLGMSLAGVNVKWYVELKKDFQKSHELNFKESELLGSDITKIPDETFSKLKGKVDIIFAGFPCQSFSHGGKKDPDDPRGQLFIEFVRAVRLIEPKFIIGENVKGLLSRKTKKGENFFDIILESFLEIGYICDYKVLKSDDFGVPQKRERLLIVGTPGGFRTPFQPKTYIGERPSLENILHFDMYGALKVPKELFEEAEVPEDAILIGNSDDDDTQTIHPYLKLKAGERGITYHDKYISEYSFSYEKRKSPVHCEIVNKTKPSKTIICTYDHQPRLFVPLLTQNGDYFLRPYTINELKEIQGFPRDYQLYGSLKNQIVQLGNAVPPPMVRAVVQWLAEQKV
jgi:DNA (cytosine-5)-methyltransferase 1